MLRRSRPPPGLEQLVAACEAGSTCRRSCDRLSGPSRRHPRRDRHGLHPVRGRRGLRARGGEAARAARLRRAHRAGRSTAAVQLPMVSARRVLGCIVVRRARAADIATARLIAGVAAQAVEAARMWESGAAGSGTVDLLTGLPNHRGFTERSARELSRAKRTGSVVVARRRRYRWLRCAQRRCRATPAAMRCCERRHGASATACAPTTACAGWAATSSVWCCPAWRLAPAATLMSRLAQAFATSTDGVTVSGGVASFPTDGATHGELQRLATGALYWAQRGGGGRIVSYDARVVEALSARERADQLERDTYERTIRALEATHGHSATSRAVSEYSGFLASELGLTPDRADRLRLAAFVYDSTTPGGEPAERARLAAKVAVNALDAEAADWLLAARRGAMRQSSLGSSRWRRRSSKRADTPAPPGRAVRSHRCGVQTTATGISRGRARTREPAGRSHRRSRRYRDYGGLGRAAALAALGRWRAAMAASGRGVGNVAGRLDRRGLALGARGP